MKNGLLKLNFQPKKEFINILKSISYDSYNFLPKSIVNTVIRIQKTVVLKNAITNEIFKDDPYIMQKQTKLLLCIPMLSQKSRLHVKLIVAKISNNEQGM